MWITNLETAARRDEGSLPYWFPSLQGDLGSLLDPRRARCWRSAYGEKANADWVQRRADYFMCLGTN
jgi:hypothetical protein